MRRIHLKYRQAHTEVIKDHLVEFHDNEEVRFSVVKMPAATSPSATSPINWSKLSKTIGGEVIFLPADWEFEVWEEEHD